MSGKGCGAALRPPLLRPTQVSGSRASLGVAGSPVFLHFLGPSLGMASTLPQQRPLLSSLHSHAWLRVARPHGPGREGDVDRDLVVTTLGTLPRSLLPSPPNTSHLALAMVSSTRTRHFAASVPALSPLPGTVPGAWHLLGIRQISRGWMNDWPLHPRRGEQVPRRSSGTHGPRAEFVPHFLSLLCPPEPLPFSALTGAGRSRGGQQKSCCGAQGRLRGRAGPERPCLDPPPSQNSGPWVVPVCVYIWVPPRDRKPPGHRGLTPLRGSRTQAPRGPREACCSATGTASFMWAERRPPEQVLSNCCPHQCSA